MLRIAICDDDPTICTQIENVLLSFSSDSSTILDLEVYYDGISLKKALQQGEEYDLLFLDILLTDIDGIAIATYIREEMKNNLLQIVYISASDSYALQLFESRPLNFLVKPLQPEKILQVTAKALELLQTTQQYIDITFNRTSHRILLQDIIYLQSMGRKIRIITPKQPYEYYGKLEELKQQLPANIFIPIHKSYIINYHYVVGYNFDRVQMVNGETLAISQSHRTAVRKVLLELMKRGT